MSVFGHHTPYSSPIFRWACSILAMTSIGVYGIVLAGWSSGSTYPLLGGLRSTAQVISYEIAMGLAFAAVFLQSSTLSTSGIVAAQGDRWFILLLLPSFLIYTISMVGETNRAPFDLPEAEGELVGGFTPNTPRSSSPCSCSPNTSTWRRCRRWPPPVPGRAASAVAAEPDRRHQCGLVPVLWFVIKMWVFLFVFFWLRTTLPRLRYDQFMNLGWKVLIPIRWPG